jgi:hypothetical protein
LAVATSEGTRRYDLPDFYSKGDSRILAFTNTFVDATRLRPHQITLRDRLVKFVAAHRRVINHLKLKWMIAADDANPFTREIMEIFRFETPTADRFESALSDMENIVDSDEWRREAKFSADNRDRYQADAVVRTLPVPKMLCPLFYPNYKSAKPGTET